MNSFLKKAPVNETALPWLAEAVVLTKQKTADWLTALRATGAEQFSQTGLPTMAWEGWQYTNLRPLSDIKFHYSIEAVKFDAQKIPPKILQDSARIVLVNGQYQPSLSDAPEGVTVMSMMEAVTKNLEGLDECLVSVGDLQAAPFKALNTAYLRDGIFLKVNGNTEVARPIEILFYNIESAGAAPAIYPRMFYWLGENSALTILERHAGEGVYLANSYTGIMQRSASRLRLYKFEEESASAFHFSFVANQQQKDSVFEGFSCATGGLVAREEYQNPLIDSGISSSIGGVYLLRDRQNHDFTILTEHFEPNGKSVQQFKGVIDDQARAVFQGKVHVRRFAQKTNGHQSHHALLLSEKAEANFKPELEIYADDVKCAHGATSGRLDDTALFYLRSRGIPADDAKSLLIQSFLNETLEQVSFAPVKEIYRERIRAWLAN